MERYKVIGICGPMTAGKSELARRLFGGLQFYNKDTLIQITPLAEPIKEIARKYFGWDGQKDERGRKLLQMIGTIGREYNPNCWINLLDAKIIEHIKNNISFNQAIFIIDDVRFSNEAEWIHNEFDGVVVELINRGKYSTEHESEYGLGANLIDLQINNGGTIKELINKANDMAKEIWSLV